MRSIGQVLVWTVLGFTATLFAADPTPEQQQFQDFVRAQAAKIAFEFTGTPVPPEALTLAAQGLRVAGASTAVLPGGRLTVEDAYAWARFARVALGTDDIDFRARPASAEEAAFLAALVAGRPVGPTYADLESAPVVVLAGLDAEDESPMVF